MLPAIFRDDTFRLETRRLWLRWQRLSDCEAIHAYASIEEVALMTATWPHPLSKDFVTEKIEKARAENALGFTTVLAITPKQQPDFVVGSIGTGPSPGESALEIGYMLHPDWQGRGLMSEAVEALVTVLFWTTRTMEITAYARTINPRSRRLLTRHGFERTGSETMDMPARGPDIPVDRFVLSRCAWRNAAGKQWRRGRDDVRKCA